MNVMKVWLLMTMILGFATVSLAETRTWTGNGDGKTWADERNWDSAPVSGNDDFVVIGNSSGSALTINVADSVSIGALKVTGASANDAVTITGSGNLTVTCVGGKEEPSYGVCNNLFAHSLGAVTIDVPITVPENANLGIGQYSDEPSEHPERKLVFAKPIGGSGSVSFYLQFGCHIELRAANAYSGGTVFAHGGSDREGVHVYAATPFGSAKRVCSKSAVIHDYVNALFDYDLELSSSGQTSLTFYQEGAELNGKVTEDGSHTGLLAVGPGGDCYVVNIRSDINTPNGRVQAVVPTYKVVYFWGKVVCKAVESGYGWNPTGGNARYVSTENDIGELWVGSSCVRMYAAEAFGSSMVLRFMGTWLGENGAVFEMNGNPQTFGRITSDLEGDQSLIGHVLTSSSPATATLKNAEDSVAVCAINDNVSVVLDAVNAEAVQVFSNRVNTMSGDIVVSNGTLRVSGVATFANVPRIEVAGGCFEAASLSAQSFSSVKEIVVGKNARLKVANARPFASEGVVVRLEDGTGRIEVGAGVDLALDAVYVGPTPLEGGTYSGDPAKGKSVDQIVGLGTVTLPNTEPETKPAVWTGNGGDAKITSLANWSAGTTLEDLTNRGLYPTFAEKGQSADFDQSAEFKGLVFDIPGGQPTNTFALTGTGPLALRNLGIAVEDPKTDEAYRYEIDVPVVLKASQTWNVSTDADVTLSLEKPVSGAYPIVKTGEGALDLVSANPDFGGDFTLNGGKVRVFAGTDAFGPAALGTKLVHNQNGTGAVLELHGTVIDKDIEWDQSGECGIFCLSGTNVLKRTVTMKGSTKAAVSVAEGALLRIEGGVNLLSDGYLGFMKDGAGTLEIAGSFQFSTIWAQDGLVRIKSAACYRKDGISTSYILNGGDVELTGSYQINSGWTPVNFYANCKMELNGYNQDIGNVEAYSTSREGLITSVRPATVVSRLTSNPLGRMVDYGGQLSVVFTTGSASAVFTNVINRAISTTGSLAASNGVVVVMTENASWLNPPNGAVRVADSARLVIPASKTFSKKMDFVLSGNGRLELADGVSQRCRDLYLDDASEPVEVGTWGATGSGARHIDDLHFSGKGVLDVRGSKPWGLAITVR